MKVAGKHCAGSHRSRDWGRSPSSPDPVRAAPFEPINIHGIAPDPVTKKERPPAEARHINAASAACRVLRPRICIRHQSESFASPRVFRCVGGRKFSRTLDRPRFPTPRSSRKKQAAESSDHPVAAGFGDRPQDKSGGQDPITLERSPSHGESWRKRRSRKTESKCPQVLATEIPALLQQRAQGKISSVSL